MEQGQGEDHGGDGWTQWRKTRNFDSMPGTPGAETVLVGVDTFGRARSHQGVGYDPMVFRERSAE